MHYSHNNSRISVITTVYNCQKYIEESIKSILSQTFEDFEFIIINDGSTDNTWDIIKSFDDNRIVLIDNNENKKIPFRRNQGIDAASGGLIAIHDGDDVSMPNRLELQVNYMDSRKDVFCVGGYAMKIDEKGYEMGKMDYPSLEHNNIVKKIKHGPTNPIIDPTTMFRREDFIELGKYSLEKELYLVPDLDLWVRAILSRKTLANMPVMLIKYRMNPDGMTEKYKVPMIRAHMLVIMNFLRELRMRKKRRRNV